MCSVGFISSKLSCLLGGSHTDVGRRHSKCDADLGERYENHCSQSMDYKISLVIVSYDLQLAL